MQLLLTFLLLFSCLSAFTQEEEITTLTMFEIKCQGEVLSQKIKLEIPADSVFKKFAQKSNYINVVLTVNETQYLEKLSYPNFRIEEELNDEGLELLILTAVKLKGSGPVKKLSFNIETPNLIEGEGSLNLSLKTAKKTQDYQVDLECQFY